MNTAYFVAKKCFAGRWRSLLFSVVIISGTLSAPAFAEPLSEAPERGVASDKPTPYWEYGFLSGNGRMGIDYFGDPGDETIAVTHCRLFLPLGNDERVPDIGGTLPQLRETIRTRGYDRAMGFMMDGAKEKGWPGLIQNTDPFHPAFFLKIASPAAGAQDYRRTENFQTGEVAARWTAGTQVSQRRMFVSRVDNVAVLSLTGGSVDCELAVPPIDPGAQVRAYQLNHPQEPKGNSAANLLIQQERHVTKDGITLHSTYKFGKGGYDAVLRVVTRGGNTEADTDKITIKHADEVLVLIRVTPRKEKEDGQVEAIQAELANLPADYQRLLAPHALAHGELFDRVRVDFGGSGDRKLTADELLARARQQKTFPPALLEKIYDGSRYMILCATGDERPPNLQGIWTGTWQPAWSGDYTTNTNLQLSIAHLLSAGTPELLKGYFKLIEDTVGDWRENAKKFYGARGIMAPTRESNSGAMIHWSNRFHGSFWTCGAGWMAHWYYDYYRYTGDRDFLAKAAVPLMKEAALFYEDFLFTDQSGKYRFSPSSSAENGDGDNSTQDIMVARELLTDLIAACEELHIESANIPKWQAMIDRLPPYVVAANGELQEWAVPDVLNKNDHRHLSHLYAIWQSYEFDPESTPEMWKASQVAYEARMNAWFRNPENTGDKKGYETASHGRMHLGLCAARLGRGEDVWELLTRMADGGSIHPSMATAHYENGKVFNVDANGGMPEIVNNALLFSLPGQLDLLPALPKAMGTGTVKGLLARGQIKVATLHWEPGVVECELVSGKDQTVRVRVPKARTLGLFETGDSPQPVTPAGANARNLFLKAGQPVKVRINFTTNE